MNKLFSMAAVAALALPAFATVAPVQAASIYQPSTNHKIKKITPRGGLTHKCRYKRIYLPFEKSKLRLAGYTDIRYQGTTFFAPRCAQFVKFAACKKKQRYSIRVRYIGGKHRFVIAKAVGHCHVIFRQNGS